MGLGHEIHRFDKKYIVLGLNKNLYIPFFGFSRCYPMMIYCIFHFSRQQLKRGSFSKVQNQGEN
jgi:hypothetical protein